VLKGEAHFGKILHLCGMNSHCMGTLYFNITPV